MKGLITLVVLLLLQERILAYYSYSENITVTNYRVEDAAEFPKMLHNLSSLPVLNKSRMKGYFEYHSDLKAKNMTFVILLQPNSPLELLNSQTRMYELTFPFAPNTTYLNKSLSYSINSTNPNFKAYALKEKPFVSSKWIFNPKKINSKAKSTIFILNITTGYIGYKETTLDRFTPKFQKIKVFTLQNKALTKLEFKKDNFHRFSTGSFRDDWIISKFFQSLLNVYSPPPTF